jgi:hypothetical protein
VAARATHPCREADEAGEAGGGRSYGSTATTEHCSLRPRHRTVRRAARQRQPKTDVDEEPPSFVPGGRGDAVPALLAPEPRPPGCALTELENAISTERFDNGWVWVHDFSS